MGLRRRDQTMIQDIWIETDEGKFSLPKRKWITYLDQELQKQLRNREEASLNDGKVRDSSLSILHFQSLTVAASQFHLGALKPIIDCSLDVIDHEPWYQVLDATNHQCGLIFHLDALTIEALTFEPALYEFVLVTQTPVDGGPWGGHRTQAKDYYERYHYCDDPSLNLDKHVMAFMVIVWKGRFAERLGIGQMIEDAWTGNPVIKKISLI
ncbi:hypothetical protein EG329_011659 [Mollisiaceae sp. DMI_Dod_QoI]|nr:hypothetical protein EG329_011659 [Helotiales sp. DMI_Dod_QoI]